MPYKLGYDKELDSLNHYIFIYPAVAVMTLLVHTTNRYNGFWDISWTFSVWLEAVAIVPQLYIVYKKREVSVSLLLILGGSHHWYLYGMSWLL